jgi:uncharacterized protein YggT (Ycf19 family)
MGRELFSSSHLVVVIDPLPQILVLARFLCFMAIFYLALHTLVFRFSQKPNSKLLWFFSVLTEPLTRPVRALIAVEMPEQRVRLIALVFYGVLWFVAIALSRMMAGFSEQTL